MHVIIVAIATGLLALWPARVGAQCCAQCEGDFNCDARVTVDELVTAVNNALAGCVPSERYVDNGDGTITDTTTGLSWEKKSDNGSIHDKDNTYTWSTSSPYNPDGTAFTSFLATLNSPPCFAGHCDWRLPSAAELESLVDYGRWAPAVDPVFNTVCQRNCTVTTCSCTVLDFHWSSAPSAEPGLDPFAWSVDFNQGRANLFEKTLNFYVRAVRVGS